MRVVWLISEAACKLCACANNSLKLLIQSLPSDQALCVPLYDCATEAVVIALLKQGKEVQKGPVTGCKRKEQSRSKRLNHRHVSEGMGCHMQPYQTP